MNRRTFLKTAAVAGAGVGVAGAANAYLPTIHREKPNDDKLYADRWCMVVDTRKLKSPDDFEPLVRACHSSHNVPEFRGKREIKWLWTDDYHSVFPYKPYDYMEKKRAKQDYLLLCNHCENPPCVRVCPTKATFKRKDGIVHMDYHRCIGCRFCMAGCPYGARSFNFDDPRPYLEPMSVNRAFPTRQKGVVEKCNFCADRLAVGKMPACVEASDGALIFGDLKDPNSDVRKALENNYTIQRKPGLGTKPSVFYII